MSLLTRWRHWWLAVYLLPGLIARPWQRHLLTEMRRFVQQLPTALQQALPDAMHQLTPSTSATMTDPHKIRQLADLAALLERRSPLGICLRRSLVRYHFLRRADVPVTIVFGAKFSHGRHTNSTIAGHAWVTLNGTPYHEIAADYEDFTPVFTWPETSEEVARNP
jgi:hypothetical protein